MSTAMFIVQWEHFGLQYKHNCTTENVVTKRYNDFREVIVFTYLRSNKSCIYFPC